MMMMQPLQPLLQAHWELQLNMQPLLGPSNMQPLLGPSMAAGCSPQAQDAWGVFKVAEHKHDAAVFLQAQDKGYTRRW
jgi:hypothetical protein